jgi:hypothetical protein
LHLALIVVGQRVSVLLLQFLVFAREASSRQQNVDARVIEADIVVHAVIVAFHDDALLTAIPDHIVVNQQAAALVVAADAIAAPMKSLMIVDPVETNLYAPAFGGGGLDDGAVALAKSTMV